MPSILNTQMQIVAEFEALESWEDRYKRIIQIGRELPPLPTEDQRDEHKVRGCSSTVWLLADRDQGLVTYRADSDAVIVRGLVALLLRVYSGHSPQEIINAEPAFIEELGLNTNLSSNRANGLSAMVKQIKTYALAFANS